MTGMSKSDLLTLTPMPNTPIIALDAMGGDFGPEVIIPAALLVLKEKPQVELILVGQEEALSRYFSEHNITRPANLHIQHASEVVAMDESPRSEEHTSELQSHHDLVCRLLLEKKKEKKKKKKRRENEDEHAAYGRKLKHNQ